MWIQTLKIEQKPHPQTLENHKGCEAQELFRTVENGVIFILGYFVLT